MQMSYYSIKLEVHRLSADNRPMPIIGRLFVLVSKATKNVLTAVHIDDNEISNDSEISHVSSSTFIRLRHCPSRAESDFRISVRS